MEGFVRLNETTRSKGILIPVVDFLDKKKLSSYISKAPNTDWYSSLFVFGTEAYDYFKNNNDSISGYEGTAYSTDLVFDFDSKEDVNKAKEDVRSLLNRLKEIPNMRVLDSTQVYFSGSKGFHVIVHTAQQFSPDELKVICKNIADGLETFDTVIYDRVRMFRIENTRHLETKLYKIELDIAQLKNLTMDQIKEMAKEKVFLNRTIIPVNSVDFKAIYYKEPERKLAVVDDEGEEINGIKGLANIDFEKMPKTRPKCIHALLQGVVKPGVGHRNHVFLHLGNYLRNQGYDKEAVYGALKGIARKNGQLYPEAKAFTKNEMWHSIIPRVFNGEHNAGGWGVSEEDSIFKSYCNAIPGNTPCTLHDHTEKSVESSLVKIDEVFSSFADFAENFEKNIVPTGIQFIDDYMKICVGTTTLLAGAAGCGKTTLCLNMMENANKLEMDSVFFSLDMHKNLVYLKLAQKLTEYNQDEILHIFKTKNYKEIGRIKEIIKERYGNTHFDFSGTLSMDDMKQRVLAIEQKTGRKVKLAVVDYAGRITSNNSDSHANAKYNALRSKDVASDTMAAWLILNQIGRNTGDGSNPLRTKRVAKDTGDWEESASNVITMWRPFLGMDGQELTTKGDDEDGGIRTIKFKDDVVRLYLAKNRMGRELEEVLYWDGAKGIIRDLVDEDLAEYKANREADEKEVIKLKRGF